MPNRHDESERLSQLETSWTLVVRAHADGPGRGDALAALLPRYCRAIHRYLRRVVGDESAADEFCQEFALRFVRGDFRHARPGKGRFRDYVKVAVLHLANEPHRRKTARPVPLDGADPADDADAQREAEMVGVWRQELLNRAWEALEQHQKDAGGNAFTVLRAKAEEPGLRSADLAARLSSPGEPVTEAAARQALHRAREKFAALLLDEVARSIPSTDPQAIAEELADLSLLEYCKPALDRRGR